MKKLGWFQMVTIGLNFVIELADWFMAASEDGEIDYEELTGIGDILVGVIERVTGKKLIIKVNIPELPEG